MSKDSRDVVRQLYGASRREQYLRENMGVQVGLIVQKLTGSAGRRAAVLQQPARQGAL